MRKAECAQATKHAAPSWDASPETRRDASLPISPSCPRSLRRTRNRPEEVLRARARQCRARQKPPTIRVQKPTSTRWQRLGNDALGKRSGHQATRRPRRANEEASQEIDEPAQWTVYSFKGKRLTWLGAVEAVDEESAMKKAVDDLGRAGSRWRISVRREKIDLGAQA